LRLGWGKSGWILCWPDLFMKLYCEVPSFLRLCIVAALAKRRLRGKALLQTHIGGVGLVLKGIAH
jgi:hypothetical protein